MAKTFREALPPLTMKPSASVQTCSTPPCPQISRGCNFFFGSDQDELAYPAHFTVLEVTPRDQGSELSSATMIPQMTVVADLTRSDKYQGVAINTSPSNPLGQHSVRAPEHLPRGQRRQASKTGGVRSACTDRGNSFNRKSGAESGKAMGWRNKR